MSEQVPREPTDEELLRVFARIPADSRRMMLSKAERSIRKLLEFFPELSEVVYTIPQGLEEIELADRERIVRLLKISLAMEGDDALAPQSLLPRDATRWGWQSRAPQLGKRSNAELPTQRRLNKAVGRSAFVNPILERNGWSLHQFAVEAGVDKNTVRDYMSGKTKKPRQSAMVAMAKALGVNVTDMPR